MTSSPTPALSQGFSPAAVFATYQPVPLTRLLGYRRVGPSQYLGELVEGVIRDGPSSPLPLVLGLGFGERTAVLSRLCPARLSEEGQVDFPTARELSP